MLQTSPLVFLSHSGADTDAARELKRRCSTRRRARGRPESLVRQGRPEAGRAGSRRSSRRSRTERAPSSLCRLARRDELGRGRGQGRALAGDDGQGLSLHSGSRAESGANALPPFARLYQGVRDPLGEGEELGEAAQGGPKWSGTSRQAHRRAVRRPPFDAGRGGRPVLRPRRGDRRTRRKIPSPSHRGDRRRQRHGEVLARGGRFRSRFSRRSAGGSTAASPDDRIWNVVTMRPRANPEEGLRSGVNDAAEKLGRSR